MSSHTSWFQMMSRCYDPKNAKYARYGGRGIKVCDRWICRRLFIEDMGERPKDKTLNRINNDGNYEPSNCEWATYLEQAHNRSTNKFIEFNGDKKCITEWERITGIGRKTIRKRLDYGWPVEKALTVPVSVNNRSLEHTHENRNV